VDSCRELGIARKSLIDALEKVTSKREFLQWRADTDFCHRLKQENENPEYDDRHIAVFSGQVIGVNSDINLLFDEIKERFKENWRVIIRQLAVEFIYSQNPTAEIIKQRKQRLAADQQCLKGLLSKDYRHKWVAVKDGKMVISTANRLVFFEKLLARYGQEERKYVAYKHFP
jgi:hypothetical protein